MTSPAKSVKITKATLLRFFNEEWTADGASGYSYVTTTLVGTVDHDLPEWQMILLRERDAQLFAITYQATTDGYNSIEEWEQLTGIPVVQKTRTVVYYEEEKE